MNFLERARKQREQRRQWLLEQEKANEPIDLVPLQEAAPRTSSSLDDRLTERQDLLSGGSLIEDVTEKPLATPESWVHQAFEKLATEDRPNPGTDNPAPERARPSAADRLRAIVRRTSQDDDEPPSSYEFDDEQASAPQDASTVPTAKAAPASARSSVLDRLRKLSAQAPTGDDDASAPMHDDDEPMDTSSQTSEILSGTIADIRYFNEWATATLVVEDGTEHRVTGNLITNLSNGFDYELSVRRQNHPRWGESYEVQGFTPMLAPDTHTIERYIARHYKGIGSKKAAQFVERWQEDAIDRVQSASDEPLSDERMHELRHAALKDLSSKLLHAPWTLDFNSLIETSSGEYAPGEDPQSVAKILVITRNLMLRFGPKLGLKESVVKELSLYLHDQVAAQKNEGETIDWVEASWQQLMQNPYHPIGSVTGYSFKVADMLGRTAGINPQSVMRLGPLVTYAIDLACSRSGHTHLNTSEFAKAVQAVDASVKAQTALIAAAQQNRVVIDAQKGRVFTPSLHRALTRVAENLAKLAETGQPLTARSAQDVRKRLTQSPESINPTFANGLDEAQIEAVARLMTSNKRVHVLTGGPGTGKTAIMECLLALLKSKSFIFCAPTGKASKVLNGRIRHHHYESNTIHTTLEGSPEGGFKVNRNNPLECDVLVVDESTMLGIEMADALLEALPEDAHIIFLGDPGLPAMGDTPERGGQLPSIAPGRFMSDLLEMPDIVDHVHLNKTFRNAGGILDVVKEVSESRLKVQDRESVRFRPLLSPGINPGGQGGFDTVMNEYLACVQRDGLEKTLLVMPKRQGKRDEAGWNTTYANAVLREVCNPHGEKIPGLTYKVGDRILIRQNLKIEQPNEDEYNEADVARVVNGDTGTIVGYAMDPNKPQMRSPAWLKLALDDGRTIHFDAKELSVLDHAYAMTVHSAQGSEYHNVIMVVTPGSAEFMNRNMVLTGFSRAKQYLSVYADGTELTKISKTPLPRRNSTLVEEVGAALKARDEQEPSLEPAPMAA